MLLNKLLHDIGVSPADADTLVSVFNLTAPIKKETAGERRQRAEALVKLFVSGERDREKLIDGLVQQSRHD